MSPMGSTCLAAAFITDLSPGSSAMKVRTFVAHSVNSSRLPPKSGSLSCPRVLDNGVRRSRSRCGRGWSCWSIFWVTCWSTVSSSAILTLCSTAMALAWLRIVISAASRAAGSPPAPASTTPASKDDVPPAVAIACARAVLGDESEARCECASLPCTNLTLSGDFSLQAKMATGHVYIYSMGPTRWPVRREEAYIPTPPSD